MATFSASTDPYYVAKEEVQSAIKRLQGMHEEWGRLLRSENTATCERFQNLHAEIAGELRHLDFDLQDVNATISTVEENRAKFKFDDAEIASRKEFVKVSRTKVQDIQDSVTGRQAQAKMEGDKRQVLASQKAAGAARDDRQSQVRRDNAEFLSNQRQQQEQLVEQQDEALTALSQTAQRLGETARTINVELQDQQKMLEELDEDIDKETEKLNFVMKRMGRLLKTSDNKQLCLIIGLFILLVVLIFLVVNV